MAVSINVNFVRAFMPEARIDIHIISIIIEIMDIFIVENALKFLIKLEAVSITAVGPKNTAEDRKFEVNSRQKLPKVSPTLIAIPSFPGLSILKNIKTYAKTIPRIIIIDQASIAQFPISLKASGGSSTIPDPNIEPVIRPESASVPIFLLSFMEVTILFIIFIVTCKSNKIILTYDY